MRQSIPTQKLDLRIVLSFKVSYLVSIAIFKDFISSADLNEADRIFLNLAKAMVMERGGITRSYSSCTFYVVYSHGDA